MRGVPHLGVPLELLLQGVPSEVDNALRSLVGGLRQQHPLQHIQPPAITSVAEPETEP